LLLIFSATALLGCDRDPPEPDTEKARLLGRGDFAVVEIEAGEFTVGQALRIDGSHVELQAASDGALFRAPVGNAYRLPASEWQGKVGDLAVCEVASKTWEACEVTAITGDHVSTLTLDGDERALGRSALLSPNRVTALNIKERFVQARERGRFVERAKRAGLPRVPSDWLPKVDRDALGRKGGEWYTARVRQFVDAGVEVDFHGGDQGFRTAKAALAPLPPYRAHELEVGSFVLVRPKNPGQAWSPAEVVAQTTRGAIVTDRNGDKREISRRDLVPLGGG
jgi:hypothetical protein